MNNTETITALEKQLETKREYDRKYMEDFRKNNREKYLKSQKECYYRHAEKRRAYQREYDRKKRARLLEEKRQKELAEK